MRKLGYESAFLADLEVTHDAGPNADPPEPKAAYYWHEQRVRARKDLVKRIILVIPFAAGLNRRFGWFDPPLPPYDPEHHKLSSGENRPGQAAPRAPR
jgi:hypothetical protein